MSTVLNFCTKNYLTEAIRAGQREYAGFSHSEGDATALLFSDVEAETLDNLCRVISKNYEKKGIKLTEEEAYMLTQKINTSKVCISEESKKIVLKSAYECLESYGTLGTKTILDGKINTSHWLGHCLWEAKLSRNLAEKLGLDARRAFNYGLLHDYGRKAYQDVRHITAGFERLSTIGWNDEAIGCLTHSFFNGCRSSWNDEPEESFYVDDNGNPCWKKDYPKDDVSAFLSHYKFTLYDLILNVSDLMATSYGIVSPKERLDDIAKRRKAFSPVNRGFFLAEFGNKLIELTQLIGGTVPEDAKEKIVAKKVVPLEEIQNKFDRASKIFWAEYNK